MPITPAAAPAKNPNVNHDGPILLQTEETGMKQKGLSESVQFQSQVPRNQAK
jgi:hypothetical protein